MTEKRASMLFWASVGAVAASVAAWALVNELPGLVALGGFGLLLSTLFIFAVLFEG